MRLNTAVKKSPVYTHEGAKAANIGPEQQLRRSVMACMLWEDEFYEDGQTIADRIGKLIPLCRPDFVAACAYHARTDMKLRHIPLLLVAHMTKLPEHKKLVAKLLCDVIQRPDEITEFLAIYHSPAVGSKTLSAQVKRGLAAAFAKFDEYALAKYNRDGAWKLRDALFLSHAKPADVTDGDRYTKHERKKGVEHFELTAGERLFKRLVDGELVTPDTWEVALSGGADKKETFERLIAEKKLGALAFLRNLRNMTQAGISTPALAGYASALNVERVLPFRFIAAARAVPQLEPVLEPLMLKCLGAYQKLPGKTILVLDTSGSMRSPVSGKSEMTRLDVAAALGILCRDMCEEVAIYCTAGNDGARIHATALIPPRRGFALRDLVCGAEMQRKIGDGGIFLKQCMDYIYAAEKTADRIIVLTDEQDCDTHHKPAGAKTFGKHNYVVNIASAKNGIGYGAWHHIDGWSEAVIDYIREYESAD